MVATRSKLFFLNYDIDDLVGPNLPKNGDILRYYFYHRHCQRFEPTRATARHVVDKCIKVWRGRGIPTTQPSNGVKYLFKMIDDFRAMCVNYCISSMIERQRIFAIWRERCELLFSIATKNASKKCNAEGRKLLLDAKNREKRFREAVKKGLPIGEFERREKPGPKSSKVPRIESAGEHIEKSAPKVANVVRASAISSDVCEKSKPIELQPQAENISSKQTTIIKEEIDLEWDPMDNEWTSYEDKENDVPIIRPSAYWDQLSHVARTC